MPALPYLRRWDAKGKATETAINPNVADHREEPRGLPAARTIVFSMLEAPPGEDTAVIVDHGSREVALLMEQAAGWLRTHVGVTVLSVHVRHRGDGDNERSQLLLTVEE